VTQRVRAELVDTHKRAFDGGDREQHVSDAYKALTLVHHDLTAARSLAESALRSQSREARAVAYWTIGKVCFEQGKLREARSAMRQSIRICRGNGLGPIEGAVWLSLAAVLVEIGQTAESLVALGRAEPLVEGVEVGRLEQQKLYVLLQLGEWTSALAAADRALPLIRAGADKVGEARLLLLRGVCHLGAGAHHAAIVDFRAARRLADRIGERLISALSQQNLGCTYGRLGDIPQALTCLEEARLAYRRHGEATRLLTILDTDLAETLLVAGLTGEAVDAARQSAELAAVAENVVTEGDARLMLARALLANRQFDEAQSTARVAMRLFRRSRRPGWALLAEYVALQGVVEGSEGDTRPPLAMLKRATGLADRLAAHDWQNESRHVRTYVARIALARGDQGLATAQLRDVVQATRTGHLSARANAFHAVALTRLANGDTAGALRSVRSGLTLIDRFRAVLGATDLRSAVAVHGVELARLGFRIALASQRPAAAFEWSERWRAVSLRIQAVTPPDDPELAALLSTLRSLHVARLQSRDRNTVEVGADGAIAQVESAIALRVRQTDAQSGQAYPVPSLRALSAQLGNRVMLAYTELDGELWLQRVDRKSWRHYRLGKLDAITSESSYLASAVRRLLAFKDLPELESETHQAVQVAASRLGDLLLGHLEEAAGDAPIVIVPSGSLSGMLWPALPGLENREVVISPSITAWSERMIEKTTEPLSTPGRVTLVAGPDLPAVKAELTALRKVHRASVILRGSRATVKAALAAFETSDLMHVASHGTFRRDNPLFSTFRLADGPLTVYELERLGRVPRSIVLSSCSAGSASVRPGDELMGAAIAFLHLGARSLIAPTDAVDDELTSNLMTLVHRHIARGSSLAGALSSAQTETKQIGHRAWANACLFIAFGA
jgi:tetratricopeptide (TPR) repeat protein